VHRNFHETAARQKRRPDTFTAYGTGYVSVNGIRHTCNLAVLPDRLIPDWTDATFER